MSLLGEDRIEIGCIILDIITFYKRHLDRTLVVIFVCMALGSPATVRWLGERGILRLSSELIAGARDGAGLRS